MNKPMKRRAGQPIIVLVALLLGWTAMRVAVWESPFPQPATFDLVAANSAEGSSQPTLAAVGPSPSSAEEVIARPYDANAPIVSPQTVTVDMPRTEPIPPAKIKAGRSEVLVSHHLLWVEAWAQMPVPGDVAQVIRDASVRPDSQLVETGQNQSAPAKRWSADGWLFLRPDAALAAETGPRFASYGASQAGAVLRYRLSPSNAARPTAYVRATQALAAGREHEIAVGLSARPIAGIPVSAHVELRATRGSVSSEVRPAAFTVTEMPPFDLPLGLRGETYMAVGYVGGDFATAFVDGQVRIDREFARFDLGKLRVGVGAWGGAQQGAARVDLGPSASMDVKLGAIPARVSVDYRLRAAGDAEPGSGAAITLSTGF